MKKNFMKKSVILIIGALLISCNQTEVSQSNAQNRNKSKFSELKGPYLGQKPPGTTPEVFAPGIVSIKEKSECNITVSPDLKEIYFSRRSTQTRDYRIWYSRLENGKLTIPEKAPFTYNCLESYPCFTPDGKRLYYISRRPLPGGKPSDELGNVWFVDKTENGWSKPKLLNSPVNNYKPHFLSIENNGTLYFGGSQSETQSDKRAIFYAELKNGEYSEVKRLPGEINYLNCVSHPAIAPDGSYIIRDYFWRENNRITGGIHISFKKPDGSWPKAVSMRKVLKVSETDLYTNTRITPDSNYLFFCEKDDLYWVSTEIIEELRPKELK